MILSGKYLLIILTAVLAVLSAGCSSGFVPQEANGAISTPSSSVSSFNPTNGLVQSSTGGSVTVDVEWSGEMGDTLVFNVAMNTHSVDLDQYDLAELATLEDEAGNEYKPVSWESSPGGHHREGVLVFPLPDSVSQEIPGALEMIIRDIAGIDERVLVWEL